MLLENRQGHADLMLEKIKLSFRTILMFCIVHFSLQAKLITVKFEKIIYYVHFTLFLYHIRVFVVI